MDHKIPLIVVCGPTASGKTALAVDIAEKFGGEVVSADSMQIYKRMDIGTAKPSKEEMQGIPHYMLDMIEPDQNYSVSDYCYDAKKCIEDIFSRGKLPVLAGGTGLYIRSLINGIAFADMKNDYGYRQSLYTLAQENGNEYLHQMLLQVDPDAAQRIHENNLTRVIRALEVYKQTGIPITEHNKQSKIHPSIFDVCMIGLNYHKRELLYQRINKRVDLMLRQGLLTEIENLLRSGVNKDCTSMQAIGYKEFIAFLDGNISIEEATEVVKQGTRRYAKRQITWFSREEKIKWFYHDLCDVRVQSILHAERFLQK